jgi:hypothetical protein
LFKAIAFLMAAFFTACKLGFALVNGHFIIDPHIFLEKIRRDFVSASKYERFAISCSNTVTKYCLGCHHGIREPVEISHALRFSLQPLDGYSPSYGLFCTCCSAINICKSDTRKLSLLLSLVIILNAWWVSFGNRCAPILSFTSILTILLFTCAICIHIFNKFENTSYCLMPLILWLSFATLLSYQSIVTVWNSKFIYVTQY